MAYAEKTQVPVLRTRADIEALIVKYGGTQFVSGYDEVEAKIMFKISERIVLFRLSLADISSDQKLRSRWRALLLCIKAKLESASSGITSFEEEFLAHFVTKDGQTLGQKIIPMLDDNLKKTNLLLGM